MPVLTSQRIFLDAVRKYCLARGIEVEIGSEGWLVVMRRGERRRLAFAYDVGLNSAVAFQIANDKAATAGVLRSSGVPCIAHTLFLGPKLAPFAPSAVSRDGMLSLLAEHPAGLVVKPNQGTSGDRVFRVSTPAELDSAIDNILSAYPNLAASPFVEIDDEVRVVLIDDRAVVVYRKERPFVTGDGRRSLRELVQEIPTGAIGNADPDAIVPKGARHLLDWRHNLDAGARPVLLDDGEARDACIGLAREAAQAIGIRFASIDVVRVNGGWYVLEINAGVKMEALSRSHPELVYAAYEAALDKVFAA